MLQTFLNRDKFDYGVKLLDDALQTEELPYSFVLYQEQIMSSLSLAGFDMGEGYKILKGIGKKKIDIVMAAKDQFIKGFSTRLNSGNPAKDDTIAHKVWKIIEDAAAYGFNASHAFSVALDSLYGAYLKAHHTYAYYEAIQEIYTEKGDKDKVSAIVREMEEAFGIHLGRYKFGLDNRSFTSDKDHKRINPALKSVKYINTDVANSLYELGKDKSLNTFPKIYDAMKNTKGINKRHIETLVRIGYFEDFGSVQKMNRFLEAATTTFARKTYHKEKTNKATLDIIIPFANKGHDDKLKTYSQIDMQKVLEKAFSMLPDEEMKVSELWKYEFELTGNVMTPAPNGIALGSIVAKSYRSPSVLFKSFRTGAEGWMTLKKGTDVPERGDTVAMYDIKKGRKRKDGSYSYTAKVRVIGSEK